MAMKKSIPAKPVHNTKADKPKAPKSKKPTAPQKPSAKEPSRKSAPAPSKPAKNAAVKKEIKNTPSQADKAAAKASAKASARDDLRSRILARAKTSKPLAFSLDEAKEIAKTAAVKAEADANAVKAAAKSNSKKHDLPVILEKPATPNLVKAASLADILGFNPTKKKGNPTVEDEENIPERFRRYYKILIELRDHVTGQLDTHTEETLKRSSKDDAGDLSSYGQHMADAGTDTFDRDFALSLVSNEQEALSEIDAAITRIKNGSYGVCEATAKPIAKERLMAVPFTRFTADAQKDIEKNRYRSRQQAGLFGEMGEDGAKIADEDAGGDE